MQSSKGQKRKFASSGKFTLSGKKRANMEGNVGSANQAKEILRLTGNVVLKDGKTGEKKWNIWRKYVKEAAGGKSRRGEFSDAEWTYFVDMCARHDSLKHVQAMLLAPASAVNQDLKDALTWGIKDSLKKARTSLRHSGGIDESLDDEEDDIEDTILSPSKRTRPSAIRTVSPTPPPSCEHSFPSGCPQLTFIK